MNRLNRTSIQAQTDIFRYNNPSINELTDLQTYFTDPLNIRLIIGRSYQHAVQLSIQSITPFNARLRPIPITTFYDSIIHFIEGIMRTPPNPSAFTTITYDRGEIITRFPNDPVIDIGSSLYDQSLYQISSTYNNPGSSVTRHIASRNHRLINPPTFTRNDRVGTSAIRSTMTFPLINIPLSLAYGGISDAAYDFTANIESNPGFRVRLTHLKVVRFIRLVIRQMYDGLVSFQTRFDATLRNHISRNAPGVDVNLLYLSAQVKCDWFGARNLFSGRQTIRGVDLRATSEQTIVHVPFFNDVDGFEFILLREGQERVDEPLIVNQFGQLLPAKFFPQLEYLALDFLYTEMYAYLERCADYISTHYDDRFLNDSNTFASGWGFKFMLLERNPDDTFSSIEFPTEIPIPTFRLLASRDDIPAVFQKIILHTPTTDETCGVQALQNILRSDTRFIEEIESWISYLKVHEFSEEVFLQIFADLQMNYIIIFRGFSEMKFFYPRTDLPAIVIFCDISHCEVTDYNTFNTWVKGIHSKFSIFTNRYSFQSLVKRFLIDFTFVNSITPREHIFFLDLETEMHDNRKPYLLVFGNSVSGWASFSGERMFEDFFFHLRHISLEQPPKKSKKAQSERLTQCVIYSFNGGRFDYVYLLPYLTGQIAGTLTDIKYIRYQTQFCSFLFADLARTLTGSLKKLAINYGLQNQKIDIELPTNTPDISSPVWSEVVEYCVMDCKVLEELVFKFEETITSIMNEDLPLFNKDLPFRGRRSRRPWVFKHPCVSAASLALNIYKTGGFILDETGSYPPASLLPHGLLREHYSNVCSSYFGGHTQVYIPMSNEGLYYYDINSSYPHSMLRDMPLNTIDNNHRDHLPEFSYEVIKNDPAQRAYIGLNYISFCFPLDYPFPSIPIRIKEGLLWPSIGRGFVWDDHLIWLIENIQGFSYVPLSRLQFIKGKIFTNYINTWYAKKSQTSDLMRRDLYKKLLNSLYGKFGQQEFNDRFIVDQNEMLNLLKQGKIKEIHELPNSHYMVLSPNNSIHPDHIGSLVHIASYITSLSRLHLFQQMHKIHFVLGGKVFYCDTDSIFTNVKMDENDISSTVLGKWKLETSVTKALFFGSKSYFYLDESGDEHLKFKGIPTQVLKDNSHVLNELLFSQKASVNIPTTWTRKFGFVLNREMKKTIQSTLTRRNYSEDLTSSKPWVDEEAYNKNKSSINTEEL